MIVRTSGCTIDVKAGFTWTPYLPVEHALNARWYSLLRKTLIDAENFPHCLRSVRQR